MESRANYDAPVDLFHLHLSILERHLLSGFEDCLLLMQLTSTQPLTRPPSAQLAHCYMARKSATT